MMYIFLMKKAICNSQVFAQIQDQILFIKNIESIMKFYNLIN